MIFVFQAEDGIRDLVRSRGLGDVYKRQILHTEKRTVDRIQYLPKNVQIDFELTDAQQKAFAEVKERLDEKPVCLLHGVTSSGKTNIYIKLIEDYIKTGKQVLYLSLIHI